MSHFGNKVLTLHPSIYVTNATLVPTPRDVEVYDFIVKYRETHTFSPTLSEIAIQFKNTRQGMHRVVDRLVEMGCLIRDRKRYRGVVPVKSPLTLLP